MRCLGQIESQKAAEEFIAYLLTLEISTQIESVGENGDAWEIWVRDEDKLAQAKEELVQFQRNPSDPKYAASVTKANQLLEEQAKARQQAAKNVRRIDTSNVRRGLMTGGRMPPLTLTLLILSIGVGLVSNFSSPGPNNKWGLLVLDQLSFVSSQDIRQSDGDPAASLKRGQVWRAITPIFVHIGILHLAMNMFMLASFGRLVERWIGTPKFALMVLVLAIGPNLFQGLSPEWMRGSYAFGGISGVLYGLFGYVWIRTSINPGLGISIPFPMIVIAIGLIVIGLSGMIPNWRLADLCHLGGLVIGAAFGFASEQSAGSP